MELDATPVEGRTEDHTSSESEKGSSRDRSILLVLRIAATVGALFGVWISATALLSWPFLADLGPGPAFFPTIAGLLFLLGSVLWFFRTDAGEILEPDTFFIPRAGLFRILAVVLLIVLFGSQLRNLGLIASLFVFSLATFLTAREGSHLSRAALLGGVTLAFVIALGFSVLFESLGVPMPKAQLPLLRDMGL